MYRVKATANAKESLEWGTKIVGGVKPGVEGEHLGLPIFPSVRVVRLFSPWPPRIHSANGPRYRLRRRPSPTLLPSMFREI
jgi:hypothetical protein